MHRYIHVLMTMLCRYGEEGPKQEGASEEKLHLVSNSLESTPTTESSFANQTLGKSAHYFLYIFEIRWF